jgi:hypothetical protein
MFLSSAVVVYPSMAQSEEQFSVTVDCMGTQMTLRKISRRAEESIGTKVGDEVGRRGHGTGRIGYC